MNGQVRYDFLISFQDVFPDKATERKILSLAIKCPSEGCEWTGELRNKEVTTEIIGEIGHISFGHF